ncbi:MAG: carboxypeptidase-like regulatory domain-containing protein [Terriglobia bacterium]|jgi:hypothetical protein
MLAPTQLDRFSRAGLNPTGRLGFFFALLFCVICSSPAWAQKDTGSIAGTVNHTTDAVIPGAKVTVTEVDKGTNFVTTTGSSGDYVATPLPIGRYRVAVEKEGLKTAVACPVRTEMFNFPNHANLQLAKSGPQNSINTTTFGTPQFGFLTAARPARQIQFALKVYF